MIERATNRDCDGHAFFSMLASWEADTLPAPSDFDANRCLHCGGTGFEADDLCDFCAGTGRQFLPVTNPDIAPGLGLTVSASSGEAARLSEFQPPLEEGRAAESVR